MSTNSLSPGKFRRGFGLDPIKSDMPLGGVISGVVHVGIVLSALLAWQATPRIMPQDVIAVDVVSDTPDVLGENTGAETAEVGEDTPNPAPLPQTSAPSPSEALPEPTPTQAAPPETTPEVQPTEQTAPVPAPTPAPTKALPPPPPPPPPPPAPAPSTKALAAKAPPTKAPTQKPAPTPLPAPAPAARATPQPKPQPTRPAVTKATAPAKVGARKTGPAPLPEFDLAAASSSASGADSGGRRAPQLASRGQAGRIGKAGGGSELTGDLEAALRAQLKRCWVPPADMSNPRQLIVTISIDLGIDGQLLRQPVLVSPTSADGASQRVVVAIDNAKRAVIGCSPFNLPPDRYDSWRQVRFKFDPELMARR